MRRIINENGQKLSVAMLTLFGGILAVLLINKFFNSEDFTTVDKSDLESAVIVTIAPKPPRFTETFRACRPGYIQGYETNDGIILTERSSSCEKPKKRDKRILHSDNERIISKIETKERSYYEIYHLKNSHCIDTPTLETGLELEEWLNIQE